MYTYAMPAANATGQEAALRRALLRGRGKTEFKREKYQSLNRGTGPGFTVLALGPGFRPIFIHSNRGTTVQQYKIVCCWLVSSGVDGL